MFQSRFDNNGFFTSPKITYVNEPEEKKEAKIKIVGVGGGGCNAVNSMILKGLTGVEFIAINTDAQSLYNNAAPTKIQIGRNLTKMLGTGGDFLIGENALREDEDKVRQALLDCDMIFITSCFGGGTGTGAAPLLAEIAKSTQALVLSIITKPFKFEGKNRNMIADKGIEKMREIVDSLIILKNDTLQSLYGSKCSAFDMFDKPNEVLFDSAKGITEMIMHRGVVNVDFADVRRAMLKSGEALIGTGKARGDRRAQEAAEKAIQCPLLEGLDIRGSKNVLVNITGSNSLSSEEFHVIMDTITVAVGEEATIKPGIVQNDKMDDEVAVTVIATGYKNKIRQISDNINIVNKTQNMRQTDDIKIFNFDNQSASPSNIDIDIPIKPYSHDDLPELDKPIMERLNKQVKQEKFEDIDVNSFKKNFDDATKKTEPSEMSKLLKNLMD